MAPMVGIKTELFYSGDWHDISDDVWNRDPVTITRGIPEDQSSADPGTLNLTLNNGRSNVNNDVVGRYSPRNPRSDLYGVIGRNTPIRVTASLGAVSSIRFTGEVVEWPVRWDLSDSDVWVEAQAAGVLRRLNLPGSPLSSTMRRFVLDQTPAPAAYWPMDDGNLSDAGTPLVGDSLWHIPSPKVTIGRDELAPWLGTGITIQDEQITMRGNVQMSPPTHIAVDHLRRAKSGGTGPSVIDIRSVGYDDDGLQWIITITPDPFFEIEVAMLDSGSFVFDDTATFEPLFTDDMHLIRFEAEQRGSSIDWRVVVDGATAISGTATSRTLSDVGQVRLSYNPGSANEPMVFGHVTVWDDPPDVDDVFSAATAHTGEHASARAQRAAQAADVPIELVGPFDTATAMRMGPQDVESFPQVLEDASKAEAAMSAAPIITEQRTSSGLQFRTLYDLLLPRGVDLELDYSAGHVHEPFRPLPDDANVANDVRAARAGGGDERALRLDGPLGINTIGRYDRSEEFNTEGDEFLRDIAGWWLRHGTWDEDRYPQIRLNLRALAAQAPIQLAADSFNRTVADGWGVSDTGQEWSVVDDPTDFSVSSGEGHISGVGLAEVFARVEIPTGGNDYEVLTSFRITGSGEFAFCGVLLRQADTGGAGSYYEFSVDIDGDMSAWRFTVANDYEALDPEQDFVPIQGFSLGATVWMRARAVGNRLQARAWMDGQPEPAAWIYDVMDNTIESGNPGAHMNDSSTGFTGSFDTFSVFNPVVPMAMELDSGSLLVIRNPPVWLPPEDIEQIVLGYTESISLEEWTIDFNTTPAGPFRVGVLTGEDDDPAPDAPQRYDTAGSTTGATFVAGTDTSLSVSTDVGEIWTTDAGHFPFDIMVAGVRLRVTNITGSSSPQTFTVQQQPVNGIEKTIPSGASVRLFAQGAYAI